MILAFLVYVKNHKKFQSVFLYLISSIILELDVVTLCFYNRVTYTSKIQVC